ncbi:MAG TPA: hypothetical protein DCY42_11480 [Chloroflexi bacterium]|nr:hypothetical protein [Chloroflexota bacterium]
MQDYFPGQTLVLVFGASEDKDIAGMFAELLPHSAHMLLMRAGHPRAAAVEHLVELAAGYDCQITILNQSEGSYELARQFAGPEGVILVTGSLYLVGEIRTLWCQK